MKIIFLDDRRQVNAPDKLDVMLISTASEITSVTKPLLKHELEKIRKALQLKPAIATIPEVQERESFSETESIMGSPVFKPSVAKHSVFGYAVLKIKTPIGLKGSFYDVFSNLRDDGYRALPARIEQLEALTVTGGLNYYFYEDGGKAFFEPVNRKRNQKSNTTLHTEIRDLYAGMFTALKGTALSEYDSITLRLFSNFLEHAYRRYYIAELE